MTGSKGAALGSGGDRHQQAWERRPAPARPRRPGPTVNFRADQVRQAVRDFDFPRLFVEELGWDNPPGPQSVDVAERSYDLEAVAEKSGLVAYVHRAADLPPRAERMKIERKLARQVHEHLLVFVDHDRTRQVWQWVRRQAGQTPRYREHTYRRDQTGELLVQKLQPLAFSLDEDPSIADVTGRARKAFDVDRVTRRFYDKFKSEHAAFQESLKGAIPLEKDREVYTSVMLDRLMFVYFIQKKGFLDDDPDYLWSRLKATQETRGPDQFLSFYRHFLRRFFHEGLGQPEIDRDPELMALIGDVPYLNGGIFDVHQIEETYPDIQVDDLAFVKLFGFFDRYEWHLDDRPLRDDREINPDVLGYIFEKYVNQKLMGAYYTKEDITGYIAQNTVIPRLFDMARKDCAIAFGPSHHSRDPLRHSRESGNPSLAVPPMSPDHPDGSVWRLLSENPDRYIYPSVRKGVDRPLPAEVAAGLDDVSRRGRWNEPADDAHALPTETWREHVARRQRYEEVWEKLVEGEIHSIDDLITLNLDIRQFAQDVIRYCEGPELLRAFWKAIRTISVLDPACGSGAFLFAALDVLEPLYDACLERMEAFLDELDNSNAKHSPARFSDFRRYLADVAKHPNRRYYILKSIVIGNLYGVDIMEEAVEICKLRLFLKLAAQADTVAELEPLPDIDFNIRAGNSLVGFTSLEAVERAMTIELDGQERQVFPEDRAVLDQINERARLAATAFARFQQMQTVHDLPAADFHQAKADLRTRLHSLERELDIYLAREYEIDPSDQSDIAKWLDSHQPFHWFVEFHGILQSGGFDIILGNPPFLEARQVKYSPVGLVSAESKAIHGMFAERATSLLHRHGAVSLVMPMALTSTQRMRVVQQLIENGRSTWYSNFSWRPGKLFDTVNRALTIFLSISSKVPRVLSTSYIRWTKYDREDLFERIAYTGIDADRDHFWVPKLGSEIELEMLARCLSVTFDIRRMISDTEHRVYYRTTGGLYWKVFTDFIPSFTINGEIGQSSRQTHVSLSSRECVPAVVAALSSDVFWWWYTLSSNLRDLNPYDIQNFPLPKHAIYDAELQSLGMQYIQDIASNSTMHVRNQKQTGRTETQMFKIQRSKQIIDSIDRVLAKHYGFTDEELDFIINYDIKYRMGQAR